MVMQYLKLECEELCWKNTMKGLALLFMQQSNKCNQQHYCCSKSHCIYIWEKKVYIIISNTLVRDS